MFKKSINKKYLVDKSKLPDLQNYNFVETTIGYLSQLHDSLSVLVKSTNDMDFQLILVDENSKFKKEVIYKISEDEFNLSIVLAGRKVLNRKIYTVPNSIDPERIMNVIVYYDTELIVCEYEAETEVLIDTLPIEKWFTEEITNKKEYKNTFIAINKTFKI